jgi:hypothetical protein
MSTEVYSIPYERDGFQFTMRVLADKTEAEFIADSLGLGEPEKVIAIIPEFRQGLN